MFNDSWDDFFYFFFILNFLHFDGEFSAVLMHQFSAVVDDVDSDFFFWLGEGGFF